MAGLCHGAIDRPAPFACRPPLLTTLFQFHAVGFLLSALSSLYDPRIMTQAQQRPRIFSSLDATQLFLDIIII